MHTRSDPSQYKTKGKVFVRTFQIFRNLSKYTAAFVAFAVKLVSEFACHMPKLFMLLIGCTPPERHIEQHDVFFGVGESIKDLVPELIEFWPGQNRLHIDAWRVVTSVNGHKVEIQDKAQAKQQSTLKLFFINLGGYKQNEFEEFHYKMIIAAPNKGEAIDRSKQTAFFRHTGFQDARAHVDDKYGIDVDDVYEIADILNKNVSNYYSITVSPSSEGIPDDEIHIGYFKLSTL